MRKFNPCGPVNLLILLSLAVSAFAQRTLSVPGDSPTIQAGINAAANGDVVLVSPGTYYENISFRGKAITVQGNGTLGSIVIDGGAAPAPAVTFNSGEGRSSQLIGFVIQHGQPANAMNSAGGILISGASPSLIGDIVANNMDCGIASYNGSPLISATTVTQTGTNGSGCNFVQETSTQEVHGTGVLVIGDSGSISPTIISSNTISNNAALLAGSESTGGLRVVDGGLVVIENNQIFGNQGSRAGGVRIEGGTQPAFAQNLIYGNLEDASQVYVPGYGDSGGGINLGIDPSRSPGDTSLVSLVNNTVVGNHVVKTVLYNGSQVFIGIAPGINLSLLNNLFIGDDGLEPFFCGGAYPPSSLVLSHNDIYSFIQTPPSAANYCAITSGQNGNVSADPLFSSTNESEPAPFQLQLLSPAVDAGENEAPNLLSTDFLGAARIQNAKGLPSAVIDMGAYEHAGVPASLAPGDFSISVSPASVDVSQSESATVLVSLVPNSTLNATVSLACTGLPANVTCTFQPSNTILQAGISQTLKLMVSAGNSVADVTSTSTPFRTGSMLLCAMLTPLVGVSFPRKRRGYHKYAMASITLLGSSPLLGCGVHLGSRVQTQQATITIVAMTAQGLVHQATVYLTINA